MKLTKHVKLFEDLNKPHTEEEMDHMMELNLIPEKTYFKWYIDNVKLTVNNLAWIETESYNRTDPKNDNLKGQTNIGIRARLKFKDYDAVLIYPDSDDMKDHTVEVVNKAAEKAHEWGAKFVYLENAQMVWQLRLGIAYRIRLMKNDISKTYYDLDRSDRIRSEVDESVDVPETTVASLRELLDTGLIDRKTFRRELIANNLLTDENVAVAVPISIGEERKYYGVFFRDRVATITQEEYEKIRSHSTHWCLETAMDLGAEFLYFKNPSGFYTTDGVYLGILPNNAAPFKIDFPIPSSLNEDLEYLEDHLNLVRDSGELFKANLISNKKYAEIVEGSNRQEWRAAVEEGAVLPESIAVFYNVPGLRGEFEFKMNGKNVPFERSAILHYIDKGQGVTMKEYLLNCVNDVNGSFLYQPSAKILWSVATKMGITVEWDKVPIELPLQYRPEGQP